MNIFDQTVCKYTHFLHQNYSKRPISKFKFQNSKISLAPLRRLLAIRTEILVSIACPRCLRSFQAPMKRLRHVDVTMTLTSSGVVIRSLPDGGLSFLLPGCLKRVCRRKIASSLHPKLHGTSATRVPASISQNAVFL